MAKKRLIRKRPKKGAADEGSRAKGLQRTLSGALQSLEVTRAEDGLFRGTPEPVLVVGLFETLSQQRGVRLLDRKLFHFNVDGAIPGTYRCEEAKLTGRAREDSMVSLVVIALEEDDRTGVTDLYGLLEQPDVISFWFPKNDVPEVERLSSLVPPPTDDRTVLSPARVLFDARDAHDLGKGDDFVGTAIGRWSASPRRTLSIRAPFSSADKRQEWSAVLELSIR